MSELISQLITPELRAAMIAVVVLLVILYVLSIIWVARDANLRGTYWYIWAVVALIPVAGVIAYCLLRPPLLLIDRDEQELEIALREHELQHYGTCPNCGAPIDRDFIVCPMCDTQVRNVCPNCHRPLDADWHVCPYCRTRIG